MDCAPIVQFMHAGKENWLGNSGSESGECSRSLKGNLQEHKLCRKDVADFGSCRSVIDRSSSGAL